MPHRTLIIYIYQSPGPGEFGISRVRREATGLFHARPFALFHPAGKFLQPPAQTKEGLSWDEFTKDA
jgi:hypothetical protein